MIQNSKFKIQNNCEGQSLLEVIVAVAVGTIAVLAAITVLTLMLRVGRQDISLQTAAFLEQELIDNITVTVERDWQQLAGVSEGQNYHLVPAVSEGTFEIQSGVKTRVIGDVNYDIYFQVSPVSRDGNGKITPTYDSSLDDPSTKKIDVFISWPFQGDTSLINVSRYITRNRNLIFRQTSWSGGPTGITNDPIFTDAANTFFNATGTIDFKTQPGEIRLNIQ